MNSQPALPLPPPSRGALPYQPSPKSGLSADELLADLANVGGKAAIELMDKPLGCGVRPPVKARYSHQAMADILLENPWISQGQVAAYFGRSQAWISIVLSSDAFKSFYASRRSELLDPELQATLQERFKALTEQGLRVLQEKLCRPASEVPDNLVLRAVELGAKSLGLGGNAPPPPPPNPAEYLPMLTERLLRLGARVRADVVSQNDISDATFVKED